jgi:hypothetical protein
MLMGYSKHWGRGEFDSLSFWRTLAWVGSFGLGLTAFLSLSNCSHFEYHSFKDIVATSAFVLYPEQQDWWLYLLALIAVPLFTLVGYAVWVVIVGLLRGIEGHAEQPSVGFVTLTYLLWWVHPLTYVYVNNLGPMPAYVLTGIFVLGNGVLVAHRWLQRRALANPLDAPPPLLLQGTIALLGAVVGVSLLTSPVKTPLSDFPARTVAQMALGFWGIWLGGAYLLSRALHRGWRTAAESLSVGCLPLSLLSIQGVLWWEVYQGGVRVVEYGSSTAPVVLSTAVVVTSMVVTLWALRALAQGRKVSWRKIFERWFFGLTVPLLIYGLTYRPNIYGPLDLFHEGERVSPAYALMAGQIPYRDVVFVHGFLRDPGVALGAFRLFDTSIAALRTLEHLLRPLGLVATYYLALACLGNNWALLYSLLALTGFFPLFGGWKIVPLVVTLGCLILYVRERRLVWAVSGSIATFVALAVSFDVGMVALAAGAALSVALSLAEWREAKLTLFLGYFVPILLCTAVVMLYLASVGALASFLSWHWQTLLVYRDWNGMPFPIAPSGLHEMWNSFLSPLASVVAVLTLSLALVKRRWGSWNWVLFLLLIANMLLYNRGVVSGSVQSSALRAGSHLTPVLLLALLTSHRSGACANLPEVSTAAVLSLALLLPTPVHPAEDRTLVDVMNRVPMKNRVEIPSSWVQSGIERIGPIFLPSEQASSLAEVVEFLGKAESFWDFTDHGALYFLSGHLSPTRFYATHHVVTSENQREVIADLARRPPRYVIFRSGTYWDAIAGVDRTLRSFMVSEYLLKNYHLAEEVGGFTLLERGAPLSFPVPLMFRVDLGHVPFLWGRDRTHALEALHPSSATKWVFSSGKLDGWQPVQDVLVPEVQTDGWFMLTAGSDPQVQNLDLVLDPRSVTYLVLRMCVEGETEGSLNAQLFWRLDDREFVQERSVLFSVVPDGQDHVYLLRLASFPGWTWSGPITGLRLDPADTSGVRVIIRSMEFIQVDEITPEMSNADVRYPSPQPLACFCSYSNLEEGGKTPVQLPRSASAYLPGGEVVAAIGEPDRVGCPGVQLERRVSAWGWRFS